MKTAEITIERLNSADDFRCQLQCYKPTIAFAYGPISDFLPEEAKKVRDAAARSQEQLTEAAFVALWHSNPFFRIQHREWVKAKCPEPAAMELALSFYRRLIPSFSLDD